MTSVMALFLLLSVVCPAIQVNLASESDEEGLLNMIAVTFGPYTLLSLTSETIEDQEHTVLLLRAAIMTATVTVAVVVWMFVIAVGYKMEYWGRKHVEEPKHWAKSKYLTLYFWDRISLL